LGAKGQRVSPHIVRNVTYRNMGGGIGSMKKSTAIIEENICFENFYAGIGHNDASPLVINNLCYELRGLKPHSACALRPRILSRSDLLKNGIRFRISSISLLSGGRL